MIVLRVQDIGKTFPTYRSEWHRLGRLLGLPIKAQSENWVLRDVSFSIHSGEAVGIIGRNGAGKSTLLKILCRTLQPTTGTVEVAGKIAALLELGMGFNPELSGRANVYITAGLMGYSREQITSALPAIEGFAEIGAYFDAALRTYSSGMQVRLAFSIATAFRPEVLIVDEALSVGDSYFQHKSFARIKEFQDAGTTLLFVSHDRATVLSLCQRAILIDDHRIRKDGAPEQVFDLYNALIAEQEETKIQQLRAKDGRVQTISGTGEALIMEVTLVDGLGFATEAVGVGEAVCLEIKIQAVEALPELVVGYMIKDRVGQPVFGTNSFHLRQPLHEIKTGEILTFRYYFNANIGPGHYSIAVSLHQGRTHIVRNYEWRDLAYTFAIVNKEHPDFAGLAWVPATLEIVR